jgi:methylisocitrate lyase
LDAAVERACRYREAGADMIFPEALTELEEYRKFVLAVKLPILKILDTHFTIDTVLDIR